MVKRHVFKDKTEKDYAISNYGSELAGDILFCDICNKPWNDLIHISPIRFFEKD